MPSFTLYHTEGCHLCEMAHDLISDIVDLSVLQLQDIVDDAELMERYQVSIPVLLRQDNGKELYWPFDKQQVEEFLA